MIGLLTFPLDIGYLGLRLPVWDPSHEFHKGYLPCHALVEDLTCMLLEGHHTSQT